MKIIEQKNESKTPPITISFTGKEVEEMLCLVAHTTIDFAITASNQSIAKNLKVTGDRIDGFSEELFDLLDEHVRVFESFKLKPKKDVK